MNRLSHEVVRGLKDLEGNRGLGNMAIVWNSNSYVTIPHSSESLRLMAEGGFSLSNHSAFCIRTLLFGGTLPVSRQTIIDQNGLALKIVSVKASSDGSFIVLTCENPAEKI
jgi:hypothetical protein